MNVPNSMTFWVSKHESFRKPSKKRLENCRAIQIFKYFTLLMDWILLRSLGKRAVVSHVAHCILYIFHVLYVIPWISFCSFRFNFFGTKTLILLHKSNCLLLLFLRFACSLFRYLFCSYFSAHLCCIFFSSYFHAGCCRKIVGQRIGW